MALPLQPGVTTNLRRTATPPNPQDLAAFPHFIGPTSAGPLNTPTQITTALDLEQFGYGVTVNQAADALAVAGGPVWLTRSITTTPGVNGSITKTFGNPVGVPVPLFGSVIVAGADFNGDVLITAKALGVTIVVTDPGATNPSTSVTVVGSSIQISLKRSSMAITETGTGLAAAITGSAPALALISAVAIGTGASLVTALASTALDDGAINITALKVGQSVRVVIAGNSTPLTSTYASNLITLNLATNANGEPITTGAGALAELQGLAFTNPDVFSVALVGDGSKLLGAKASTVLPFGSNGTITLFGTPNDDYPFTVQLLRAGTVGGADAFTFKWACDLPPAPTDPLFSSQVVIPSGGLVALKDSLLDTGVSVLFAGTFDVGDTFTWTATGPVTGAIDFYTALDAAIANPQNYQFGYFTSPVELSRAVATVVDSKLQNARQDHDWYGVFTARKPNPGETDADWVNSLINDYIGFTSLNGLVSISAGTAPMISTKTGRTQIRNIIIAVSSRASLIPVHEDLGFVGRGTLNNVLGLVHDESKNTQLSLQRFITARTFTRLPGQYYINSSPTFSVESDVAYSELEYVRVILSVARIAETNALQYVNSVVQVIGVLDGTGAPLGAITVQAANAIETFLNQAVRAFLFKPKSDGNYSASDTGQIVFVQRNYSLIATQELRIDIDFTPLGITKYITLNINVNIPG